MKTILFSFLFFLSVISCYAGGETFKKLKVESRSEEFKSLKDIEAINVAGNSAEVLLKDGDTLFGTVTKSDTTKTITFLKEHDTIKVVYPVLQNALAKISTVFIVNEESSTGKSHYSSSCWQCNDGYHQCSPDTRDCRKQMIDNGCFNSGCN